MKSKAARILSILISVLFLFASCGQIADVPQGYAKIRVGAPSGRAITADEKQNARFEFYFNDTKSDSNETVAQVGTSLRIKVVAIDARNGRQVATGEKTITVAPGMNNVNIVLREDRGADANMVRWSAGLATVGKVENMPAATSHAPGDDVTVPQDPTWVHARTFDGWKAEMELEVTPASGGDANILPAGTVINSGDTFKVPEGGVTLVAQWTKRDYTVSYDMNSANSGGTPSSTNIGSTQIDALEPYSVSDQEPDPVTVGGKTYTFTGWNTDAGGNGTAYSTGKTITQVTGDITLYAQWSDKNVYRVTFTAPSTKPASYTSGYGMPSPQNVEENTAATWTNPAAVGWTFEGWDVSDTDSMQPITTLGANITSYTPTSNVTLQAKWNVIEYTVNYVVTNGEGSGTYEQKYRITDSGGNITYYNGATFQRSGYSLTGWNYSDGTPAGTPNFASSATPLIGKAGNSTTITLYAKWEATEYTIQFVGGGASGSQDSIDFTVEDTSTTLPQTTTFTKPGEIFSHWATISDGLTVQFNYIVAQIKNGVTDSFEMTGNTITIYAVWKAELLDTPSVGSIIMNDGSLRTKDTLGSGEAANAVAVVYKVLGGKAWAIGKVLGQNIAWCKNGVEGYNKRFTELETIVTDSGSDVSTFESSKLSVYSFSGYEDGSTGLDILKGGVSDYSNGNGNYPAWEFCESYGTTNCAGTNFTSGWYLPSIVEGRDIALAVSDGNSSDVVNALINVDSVTYTSGPLFLYSFGNLLSSSTSSQVDGSSNYTGVYQMLLSPGASSGSRTFKETTTPAVWAVRQFTY